MTEKADGARRATLVLLALLALMLALETPLLLPPAMKPLTVLFMMALKAAPLLAFIRPVRRGRADSAVWLGFLLMFYFCWAVLGLFAHGIESRLALARMALITGCFGTAMLFSRWQRAAREP